MSKKISKKERQMLLDLILVSIPLVMIAIGVREFVLKTLGITTNEGMIVIGVVWLIMVFYFRK